MELEQKVDTLQGEVGLVKAEIKQILVDLREFVMNERRPFPDLSGPSPANGNGRAGNQGQPAPQASGPAANTHVIGTQKPEPSPVQVVKASPASGSPPAESGGQGAYQTGEAESQSPDTDFQAQQAPSGFDAAEQASRMAPPVRWVTAAAPAIRVGTLDANLMANLIRWVATAKGKLGVEHLQGLLEAYKLTGHLPPLIEKLILQVAKLNPLPEESDTKEFTADSLLDTLVQLHGIIYGPGYPAGGQVPGYDQAQAQPGHHG